MRPEGLASGLALSRQARWRSASPASPYTRRSFLFFLPRPGPSGRGFSHAQNTLEDPHGHRHGRDGLLSGGPGQPGGHQTGRRPSRAVSHTYCVACNRRMQGNWVNDASYYRCRFPEQYALANKVAHPRNVAVEAALLSMRSRRARSWVFAVCPPWGCFGPGGVGNGRGGVVGQ